MNKPCLDCGVPNPNSRCVQCAAIREQNKIRNRATAFERGYDKAWYKVRNKVLARDKWICYMCNKKLIGSDAKRSDLAINKSEILELKVCLAHLWTSVNMNLLRINLLRWS
jgi:hypothetical protein